MRLENTLFVFSIGILCVGIIVFVVAYTTVYTTTKTREIRDKIEGLANNTFSMTPEEFMAFRRFSFGGRGQSSYALTMNYAGVYIIHNESKNLYYIGQGKQVLNRVNAHFTGHGNGDIYADYKYGDRFTIKTIALDHSGFPTLNELERYCISCYDSYWHGYNKTRGNRR